MGELSPAALAVFYAWIYPGRFPPNQNKIGPARSSLVQALRAVAEQVTPEEPIHGPEGRWEIERDQRQEIRCKLLSIAAELERSNA